MTKHFRAFRDNYLAAFISAAALLLSAYVQAQKTYQPYPTPGQAKYWMVDSTLTIPYGSVPSLRGGATRPGALFLRINEGDTTLLVWTGSIWKVASGAGSSSGDSTQHNLKVQSSVFTHTQTLVGYDPSCECWIYDDSLSLGKQEGQEPADHQILQQRGGVVAWYTNNQQSIWDIAAAINKRNALAMNGYALALDSGKFVVNPKFGVDTVAFFGGVQMLLRGNDGFSVWHGGAVSIGSSGIYLGSPVSGRFLQLYNNSTLNGYQQPVFVKGQYMWISKRAFEVGMDTSGATFSLDDIDIARFKNREWSTNIERLKLRISGRGEIWRDSLKHHGSLSGGDTLIVSVGGYDKGVTIDELGAVIGGATDLTPGVALAGSNFTITEPSDHRRKTYMVFPSGSSVTATAPASPTDGQIISFVMHDFGAGSLTVPTFDGTQTLSVSGNSITLQYIALLGGYAVISKTGVSGSSGGGIHKAYAGNGLVNVNDSTLRVDTALQATKLRLMQVVDSLKARRTLQSFTSSSSITVDYNSRERFIGTLSHNAVFTVSNMTSGEAVFYIINGSGGPYTPTFPGGYQPTLKPNTGDTTMVIGNYNGSAWYWSTNVQYTTTGGRETFTATSAQTTFTTSGTLPSNDYKILVFRNGVEIDFTRSTNTITIPASTAGDQIKIRWYN